MSSLLKKYKENVKKNKLEFDPLMYKNTYGSFGIAIYRCFQLLKKNNPGALYNDIKNTWKRMKKGKVELPFIDDEKFVEKMCKVYGVDYEKDFPFGNISIVVSSVNSLFAPCFIDDKNKVQIIPLREDWVLSKTLLDGKPTIIVRDSENKPSDA